MEYCPTREMVMDFFTKPALQGALFQKFRNLIMNNTDPLTKRVVDHRSVLKKAQACVTKNVGRIGRKQRLAESRRNLREFIGDTDK
jgi:hypothetical protein